MSKAADDPLGYTKQGLKYGGGIGAALGAGHAMATLPSGVPHGMDPKKALMRYLLMKSAQGTGGAIGGGAGGAIQGGVFGGLMDIFK